MGVIGEEKDRLQSLLSMVRSALATPTRRRLASGAFWSSLAGLFARILAMATSFVIARFLGRERFGEYGMILSTVTLTQTLATMGIGMTATKFTAEFRNKDPDRAGRLITLSTVLTLVTGACASLFFLVFSNWLATSTLAAPHLAGLLRLSALVVLLGVMNSVQNATLAGFEAFKATAYLSAIAGVLQSVLILIGCRLAGMPGLIVAITVSMLGTVALGRVLLSREMGRANIKLNWSPTSAEWRVLCQFSVPAFLAALMVDPVLWACSALLAHQSNGYRELGAFNAANQWYSAVQFLPVMLGAAILPVLSERYGAGDLDGSLRVMKTMMGVTAAVVVPIVAALCLFSQQIMGGYGPSFRDSYLTLILTAVTAGLISIVSPVGMFIAASNRMWIGLTMNLGWAVILVFSTIVLLPRGANGLAGGRLLATAAHSIWIFGYVVITARRHRRQGPHDPAATARQT